MFRRALKNKAQTRKVNFTLRGLENTRIESLSDGVFAIAIGLLLISSKVPETYKELQVFLKDFIPFGATITLLMLIWKEHYYFFIRYGLKDSKTQTLNTMLLFLVLFYVYPLKFLFKVLFNLFYGLFTQNRELLNRLFTEVIDANDTPKLMVLYGLGAASIFSVLGLMYWDALKRRKELNLNELEIFETRTSVQANFLMGSIPLLSACIAYWKLGGTATFSLSGIIYWLYMIVMPVHSKYRGKKLSKLITQQKVEGENAD